MLFGFRGQIFYEFLQAVELIMDGLVRARWVTYIWGNEGETSDRDGAIDSRQPAEASSLQPDDCPGYGAAEHRCEVI
jgi:hypothetical protein